MAEQKAATAAAYDENKTFLQKKERLGYCCAACGQGAIYALVTTFHTLFCVYVMGIDGIALGSAMMLVRVWDAVNDPIMGTIVDRTRLKSGKMRPYLLFMPILMGVSTVLLFVVPGSQSVRLVWAVLSYLLWDLMYTITDVPFWGLPSAMTPNNQERAGFLSKARLFNCIGGAVPYVLYLFISNNTFKPGFVQGAIVIIILGSVPFIATYFVTKERIRPVDEAEKVTLKENLSMLKANKPLQLICLFGILCFGRYMVQTAYGYAATSVFHSSVAFVENMKGIFGAALIGVGMLPAMIVMPSLMRKFNYKKLAIGIALFGFVVDLIFFGMGLLFQFDLLPLLPFLFLSGIPLGAYNILIVALVADSIDYLEWKTGKRGEGISLAANSFVNKLGSGISGSIIPFILGVTTRVWGAEGFHQDYTEQTMKVKIVIFMCLTLVPSISMLIATIPMKFYTFVGKEKQEALDYLSTHRNLEE